MSLVERTVPGADERARGSYFHKHTVKWTTDCGYAFEAVDPSWASPGRGFRRDDGGADGQIVVRTQLQLLF